MVSNATISVVARVSGTRRRVISGVAPWICTTPRCRIGGARTSTTVSTAPSRLSLQSMVGRAFDSGCGKAAVRRQPRDPEEGQGPREVVEAGVIAAGAHGGIGHHPAEVEQREGHGEARVDGPRPFRGRRGPDRRRHDQEAPGGVDAADPLRVRPAGRRRASDPVRRTRRRGTRPRSAARRPRTARRGRSPIGPDGRAARSPSGRPTRGTGRPMTAGCGPSAPRPRPASTAPARALHNAANRPRFAQNMRAAPAERQAARPHAAAARMARPSCVSSLSRVASAGDSAAVVEVQQLGDEGACDDGQEQTSAGRRDR